MKNLYYIFLVCILVLKIQAQEIIIQPPLIGPYECTEFYKLYTGSVTNFSSETFKTQLLVEVDYTNPSGRSIRLADGIISGNPSIDFASGLTSINNATYESKYPNRNITFYDKGIENLLARTKCLPPGQYNVCLTLYPLGNIDGVQFLTQTCYTREKEQLSNFFLVSPFDEEEIQVLLPLFTWTSVIPYNPDATYRLQIVELLMDQSPFEAFRANPLFFEQKGLMSNILQFPISARSFSHCTQYAWRVIYERDYGLSGPNIRIVSPILQESEIWTFITMDCEEEEEEEENISSIELPYYRLEPGVDAPILILSDLELRILIDNPYIHKDELSYMIYDSKNKVMNTRCCPAKKIKYGVESEENKEELNYGENRYVFDLKKLELEEDKYYKLIINEGKEVYQLIIRIEFK